MLRPWLGNAALGDAAIGGAARAARSQGEGDLLVMPELIEVRLSRASDPAALDQVRVLLARVAPDASVTADMDWLGPLGEAISALQWLAVALVILLVSATTAAVLLASRSALTANRETIEIMHLLGAHDLQVARMFQRTAAMSAAAGGAAGFAVAEATIFVLAGKFAALGPGPGSGAGIGMGAGGLRWFDWAALVLIPVAGVLLAAVTARLTVLATLRRMP